MQFNSLEGAWDLRLVSLYKVGIREKEIASILFERYRDFLDMLSLNTVYVPDMDREEKRMFIYESFFANIEDYKGRNGASLRTFMNTAIKHDLLDERRRRLAKKRKPRLRQSSLSGSSGQQKLETAIYRAWAGTGLGPSDNGYEGEF